MFELPQNVQLKALESEEWMSQWSVPPGLHSGLFLQVNFWQLHPFQKERCCFVLSSLVVKTLQKASLEPWQQGSCWHTDYTHALNWKWKIWYGGGGYACNANTPQICGSWGVIYRKYCFESATQAGTAIRYNSRTLPRLMNNMPDGKREFKTLMLLWP